MVSYEVEWDRMGSGRVRDHCIGEVASCAVVDAQKNESYALDKQSIIPDTHTH